MTSTSVYFDFVFRLALSIPDETRALQQALDSGDEDEVSALIRSFINKRELVDFELSELSRQVLSCVRIIPT